MLCRVRLDRQLSPEAVNHDVPRGAMLRQPATRVEREEKEPERPPMDQTGLPVARLRGVGLGVERAGEVGKIERYYRSGQSSTRMRPEPLV
jgi:hypothetical protein